MKFIKENYPLLAFVGVYIATKNLILAAAVWSGGSLLQILTNFLLKQPIKKTHIAYFFVGLLLVIMAYYFNDDSFIKWKTSIMVWAAALIISFRQIFSQKFIILDLLNASGQLNVEAPQRLLKKINAIWIGFLFIFGFINLYVAYTFSTDTWFYFKVIALFVSTFGLFIISFLMLGHYLNLDDENTSINNKIQAPPHNGEEDKS